MTFTYNLTNVIYAPNGDESTYWRIFPDFYIEDYWLGIYYFIILGSLVCISTCGYLLFMDFDKLTDFEKRRRAYRKKKDIEDAEKNEWKTYATPNWGDADKKDIDKIGKEEGPEPELEEEA